MTDVTRYRVLSGNDYMGSTIRGRKVLAAINVWWSRRRALL